MPSQVPKGDLEKLGWKWSRMNFNNTDDEEAPRAPPPGYSLSPISELRRKAASYTERVEGANEPPAHFNTGDWIARNNEMRRRRPPSPDGSPPL